MAKVNITAWDVAEVLGLRRHGYYDGSYQYTLDGKSFYVDVCTYSHCQEEADEQAAQKVLGKLAELIVID